MDLAHVADDSVVWERVVRKLRTRTMPPPGVPRPDEPTYDALASWLESELDRASARNPNPGRPVIRRLNRTEYANAIRDLLDLEVETSSILPADDSAFGFDNISDLLGSSPALLDRYLIAADRISATAVGAAVEPGSNTYRIRQDRSQDQHIEGLSLGTVGGLSVDHTFPLNGEYQFSLELFRTNLEAIRGLEALHQIEMSVDGRRIFSAPSEVQPSVKTPAASPIARMPSTRGSVFVCPSKPARTRSARRSSGRLAPAHSVCARFFAARRARTIRRDDPISKR